MLALENELLLLSTCAFVMAEKARARHEGPETYILVSRKLMRLALR